MYKTVEDYLADLKQELAGSDQATIQDALSDAEEHLRMAVASLREDKPDLAEETALQTAIDQYSSPAETAAAYAEVERRTAPGLSSGVNRKSRSFLGRFFGVYADQRAWGVDILTIGQYLQPSKKHLPIARYYTLEEFSELKRYGLEIGFKWVESAPLVRSSYRAAEQVRVLSAVHRKLYGESSG